MFANLDFNHPEVVKEMERWGIWVSRELDLDGMRLDAIKHINDRFIQEKFLAAVRKEREQTSTPWVNTGNRIRNPWTITSGRNATKWTCLTSPCTTTCTRHSKQGRDYDLSKLRTGPGSRTTLRWPLPLWTTMIPSGAVPGISCGRLVQTLRLCAHPAHEGRLSCIFCRDYYGVRRQPAHAPRHHRQSAGNP